MGFGVQLIVGTILHLDFIVFYLNKLPLLILIDNATLAYKLESIVDMCSLQSVGPCLGLLENSFKKWIRTVYV